MTNTDLLVNGSEVVIKLRGLVEGYAKAPLLVLKEPLSFYGEVDPETGRLYSGGSIAAKILVMPSTRGSTVGPYILYSLASNGAAPAGIVVSKAEPLLVAGAVLAETPLAEGLPQELLNILSSKTCIGELVSEPPRATLRISCH